MKNIAVYEGHMNMIMNLAADPNDVRWTIIPTTDEFGSYQISDYDGYRDSSLTGLFYLNESGLVILNATTAPNGEDPISTSGLYIADLETNGNRTGAKLLVVREFSIGLASLSNKVLIMCYEFLTKRFGCGFVLTNFLYIVRFVLNRYLSKSYIHMKRNDNP